MQEGEVGGVVCFVCVCDEVREGVREAEIG